MNEKLLDALTLSNIGNIVANAHDQPFLVIEHPNQHLVGDCHILLLDLRDGSTLEPQFGRNNAWKIIESNNLFDELLEES